MKLSLYGYLIAEALMKIKSKRRRRISNRRKRK